MRIGRKAKAVEGVGTGGTPIPLEGVDEGAEKAILIPHLRRLWSKAEMAPELFAGPVAKGRKRTTTHGKRGVLKSKSYEMAVREVGLINSAISDETDVAAALLLKSNQSPQRCFQGVIAGYEGFVLEKEHYSALIRADAASKKVIHPFLIGRDIVTGDGSPTRFVIDLDAMDLLGVQRFQGAFQHVKKHVMPQVLAKAKSTSAENVQGRDSHSEKWWEMWRPRSAMKKTLRAIPRYIVCSGVTKRPIFIFMDSRVLADHATFAFAFPDDYSFGILQSTTHWLWFITKCSKLKSDFRYTPDTVFDTFPWPQSPTKKQVRAVAEAGREVRRIRAEALPKMKGGLRALYRTLELPGKNPLKDAHTALDAAVLDAYGFSPRKDLLAQLLALNLDVAAREDRSEAVTPPGVPPSYGDASDLVTDDCICP